MTTTQETLVAGRLVRLLTALATDCEETDGWEGAADTCREAAVFIERLTTPPIDDIAHEEKADDLYTRIRYLGERKDRGVDMAEEIREIADAVKRNAAKSNIPADWPTIWEDPAGKGYPCFERPMTMQEVSDYVRKLETGKC